jgi:hypothetical protein
MRLRRVPAAFDDPDYVFELKHDGFRAIVYIENGECRLVSRNLDIQTVQHFAMALRRKLENHGQSEAEEDAIGARFLPTASGSYSTSRGLKLFAASKLSLSEAHGARY